MKIKLNKVAIPTNIFHIECTFMLDYGDNTAYEELIFECENKDQLEYRLAVCNDYDRETATCDIVESEICLKYESAHEWFSIPKYGQSNGLGGILWNIDVYYYDVDGKKFEVEMEDEVGKVDLLDVNSDIKSNSYYGCALDLYSSDRRLHEFRSQRDDRGFDDTETWSLDDTIAMFIAPRLKRLIEIERETIVAKEEYFEGLEKLQDAFENYTKCSMDQKLKYKDVIGELFPKYFSGMWW